jgi:beta-xylosidase/pectate lyase
MTRRRAFSILVLTCLACAPLVRVRSASAPPAFPGAEGFGASTPGGRGGRVVIVSNLNDAGPGSFREAVTSRGPRIVVFAVGGLVTLLSPVVIEEPFLTVAGQTAPGDGIAIRGRVVSVKTHDVVVRHLRFRLGDVQKVEEDSFDIAGDAHDIIVDHCSATWSVDENLSPSGANRNVTVQWCLIAEALDLSVHGKGAHGYGSLARAIGGVTFHHNLWAHNRARNPRLGDNYGAPPFPVFDVRNNVIYDYGEMASGMTGDRLSVNYVNNYIRPGPNSNRSRGIIVFTDTAEASYFVEGNVVEGRDDWTADNTKLFDRVERDGKRLVSVAATPFEAPPVTTTGARQALADVAAGVGATLPRRDAVDARIVQSIERRGGTVIDSQVEVGGWPEYRTGQAPMDLDRDGMPDGWERSRGLNPLSPSDASRLATPGGYTNIEVYLNELAARRPGPSAVAQEVPAVLPGPGAPWVPDRGDGTYVNPVLHADYSDPDVVRVGDDYYMVASSFNTAPGLPILRSRDLVNWRLVGHALPRLVPEDVFATVQPGKGVWAPSIRHHDSRYWIYWGDPDAGIYVVTATNPAGKWTTPVLVKAGKGLIDPCPLWDDDGSVYLVHAWARSRAGFANVLTLNRLTPDGLEAADDGKILVNGDRIPGYRTLEGPKLYKRDGTYWIFAPAGGVKQGWQSVFRSRAIDGPYEDRIVLEQGKTDINGPHQGGWVTTAAGEDWFVHFQDREAYGRVVHLQPMAWRPDGWPVMGSDLDGDGGGEPVRRGAKPKVRAASRPEVPVTSDEFADPVLGLQWQWQANPRDAWLSLTAATGTLRLFSQPAPAADNLWLVPNLLLQKLPAETFVATAALRFAPAADGESAGLLISGPDYAWVGLRRVNGELRLVVRSLKSAKDAQGESPEDEVVNEPAPAGVVRLRVTVSPGGRYRFSVGHPSGLSVGQASRLRPASARLDEAQRPESASLPFRPVGPDFVARAGDWVVAKVGVFAVGRPASGPLGHADWEWFRVEAAKALQ